MTDDVVAIHESGHALMATVLGFELLRVTVGDGDPRYDLAPGPSRRLDRIRVLMSGGEAEGIIFDREPIGTGSDDRQIANLLGPGDDEIALRDEVRRFLRLNAGTLRYLAARLARRSVLTGDEVTALVRGNGRRSASARDSATRVRGERHHRGRSNSSGFFVGKSGPDVKFPTPSKLPLDGPVD